MEVLRDKYGFMARTEKNVLNFFEAYLNSDYISGDIEHNEDYSIVRPVIMDDKDVLWGVQGVYFLEYNYYPVYIGESGKCIYTRVFGQQNPPCIGHIEKDWIFNMVSFIPLPNTPKNELRWIEGSLIAMLDTHYNSTHRTKGYAHLVPNDYQNRMAASKNEFLGMIQICNDNAINRVAEQMAEIRRRNF